MDLTRFYLRRGFRVLPAYWVVVIVQTIVLAIVFLPDVRTSDLGGYIGANLLTANFLQPSFIEGIPALNGSLWTIKIELGYYVVLPFLFPLIARSWRWLAILFTLSMIWAFFFPLPFLAKQLPGKLFLFFMGVVIAQQPMLQNKTVSMAALVLIPFGFIAHHLAQESSVLEQISTMLLSLLLVVAFLRRWWDADLPDLSYTIYLVHYPILVLLTRTVLSGTSFALTLAVAGATVLVASYALTYAVERPGMRVEKMLTHKRREHQVKAL